jgi:YesN/AraC family two-component response regulator
MANHVLRGQNEVNLRCKEKEYQSKKQSSLNLLIKNMVSLRCKLLVKSELQNLGISSMAIELGEVETAEEIPPQKLKELQLALQKFGLELMEDKKKALIEKIKTIIIEMIHYSDEPPLLNFSNYLSEKLNYDYNYLSNLFSEVKGTTIEHYIIAHKIERAKELLIYNELSLTAIAEKLHYSNVAHLSNQFKKVTGLTPTFFKKMKIKRLTSLENL